MPKIEGKVKLEGKAIGLGNRSLVVTIPYLWREAKNLKRDDPLDVEITEDYLMIRPKKEVRKS